MDNHQLVNQTSGNTEWYSPPELVEAARRVMGSIDLDPASSQAANETIVKAAKFFTRPSYVSRPPHYNINGLPVLSSVDFGGLSYRWRGNIWMNHPFGTGEKRCLPNCKKKTCPDRGWHTAVDIPGNAYWIEYAISQYLSGYTVQACIITFASTSEAWFRPLKDYPMCLIDGRVNYLDPTTLKPVGGATKGSAVTYLGPNIDRFVAEFDQFGPVMVRQRPTAGRIE